METKLTEQQSLSIINEMIDRARNNVQKGSATSMIFWGYAVAGTALLNFVLLQVLPLMGLSLNLSFWVWTLMIPCEIVSYFIHRKIDRKALVKTHIDTIVSSAWKAFAIAAATLIAFIFLLAFGMHEHRLFLLITPLIMLMVAMQQYVTAKATRFKPFTCGAIIMWAGAMSTVVLYFFLSNASFQFLVLAICIILSYVLPGHLLNKKAAENV
jgi:hypothetical protein